MELDDTGGGVVGPLLGALDPLKIIAEEEAEALADVVLAHSLAGGAEHGHLLETFVVVEVVAQVETARFVGELDQPLVFLGELHIDASHLHNEPLLK